MPENIDDIVLSSTEFVSANQLFNIAVGSAFWLQNKSFTSSFLMVESASKPASTSTNGVLVTPAGSSTNTPNVTEGSLEIWIRCLSTDEKVLVHAGI